MRTTTVPGPSAPTTRSSASVPDSSTEIRRVAPSCARATRASGSGASVKTPIATPRAASDEFHQTFVEGRVGAVHDVAIDAAGAAIGIVLYRSVRARRFA